MDKSEQDVGSVGNITILRSEFATALQGSQTGEIERIRAEMRTTISFATSHKAEVHWLARLVTEVTEESRGAVSNHTRCSRERHAEKLARQELKEQDELFLMLYEKNTKLEEDLKDARWQASTLTTLEDEAKQLRQIVDERKISESAESTKPVKERATTTEVCVEQLSADTVAAGVSLAEETNEDN